MTAKKREDEVETMMQEMRKMREDIASVVASVKKHSEALSVADSGGQKASAGEHEGWADIRGSFDEARARGEQALKDLAAEVERHPLRSIAIAVGAGFIIAKLFGRGRSH